MHNFAPVLIITLNRYNHFKRCIESLVECTHAEKTDLYIALDYPLNESHWDGYNKIANYVNEIKDFKTVVIIKRDKNFGVLKNYFEAREEIFKKYNRIIFSEDDNIFSKDFLSFVNNGLNVYENRDDIFAISGYNFPIVIPKEYKEDVYLWTGTSCWGFGTWKNKWEKVDWSISNIKIYIGKRKNVKSLNNVAEHLYYALQEIIKTGYLTGDTIYSYHNLVNKMYTVYPTISRVRNNGHDGSGSHCSLKEIYANQKIYEGVNEAIMHVDIGTDPDIYKTLWKYFRISTRKKIKIIIKQIIKTLVITLKL